MQALFLEAGGARMQLIPSLAQALLQSPANELRNQRWLPPPHAATTIPGGDGGDGGDGGGGDVGGGCIITLNSYVSELESPPQLGLSQSRAYVSVVQPGADQYEPCQPSPYES